MCLCCSHLIFIRKSSYALAFKCLTNIQLQGGKLPPGLVTMRHIQNMRRVAACTQTRTHTQMDWKSVNNVLPSTMCCYRFWYFTVSPNPKKHFITSHAEQEQNQGTRGMVSDRCMNIYSISARVYMVYVYLCVNKVRTRGHQLAKLHFGY